ncbi:MAG: PIN domain-containing protein, partial [Polyangiaceae bacterium]
DATSWGRGALEGARAQAPVARGVSGVAPRPAITFDTGALIALERRRHGIRKVYAGAIAAGFVISVPTVVVTEWWRAGHREKERAAVLRSLRVEPLYEHIARLAGTALGSVRGAGAVDAIVMASAALRGDTVYTSDVEDLEALRSGVPGFASVQVVPV